MNIDKVLEVSERIKRLRGELTAAEAELRALAGGAAPVRHRPGRKPIKGRTGPSVSQQVLSMIVASGREGMARRDIVTAIGKAHETAIHSALKVHASLVRIKNENGRWVATAKYVQQLQPPATASAAFMGAP